jgi:hypothetical protein
MSTKTMVGIIVVLALVGGAWYFWSGGSSSSTGAYVPSVGEESATQTQDASGARVSADVSDASLDQDMAAIDAQLQAATDASASASAGDTPVEQTE